MSPESAAATSSAITSAMSMAPAAASVPTTNSSESPGRNGVTTSPVSQNTMTNSSAYTHTPCCAMNAARCTSSRTTKSHSVATSSMTRFYILRA